MHYELFMGAALGEARAALERGERPHGAAAVLGEALVASSHEEVVSRNDPTAHAVILALREAAKRLATRSLSGLTVFSTVEPCPMCVGALLEADADCLVYALSDPVAGAAGSVVQLANNPALSRRLDLISGILRSDAAELRRRGSASGPVTPGPGHAALRSALCYPPRRRGVRVVDGAALEKRCAQAPWVRIPPSPPLHPDPTARRAHRLGPRRHRPRRGRLEA